MPADADHLPPSPEQPILFYDAGCALCDRTVRWCLRHDRRGRLRFAPLKGSTYAALPDEGKPAELQTMVLLTDDGLHVTSEAVLRVLTSLGGFWAFLGGLGHLVPRFIRDAAYRFVARHRTSWFGPADVCLSPGQQDRRRFLP